MSSQLESAKYETIGRIVYASSTGLLFVALARIFSADNFGLFFLTVSILSVLRIISVFGLGKSTGRYIVEYSEKEKGQVAYILIYSTLCVLITISIFSISLYVFRHQLSLLFGQPDMASLLRVGPLFIFTTAFFWYCKHLLQSFDKINESGIIYGFAGFSRFVLVLILVFNGYGVIGAILGYILAHSLAVMLSAIILFKHVITEFPRAKKRRSEILPDILKYSVPIFMTSAATVLDKQMDSVIVGYLLNPAAVSYYSVSKQITEFVQTPVSSFGFVLSPALGRNKFQGNHHQAGENYLSSLSIVFTVYLPAAVGLFLLSEDIIVYIFGEEYLGAIPVLQIFSIYLLMQSLMQITSNSLDYLGRARERAIITGFTSIANVILNFALIPIIGVSGAAVATCITYSIYMVSNFFVIRNELRLELLSISKKIIQSIIVTLIMSIVVLALMPLITGIPSLLLTSAVGFITWLSISKYVGLLDVEHSGIYNDI